MHLRPLTEKQVGIFAHNWYKIVEKGLAKDPEQAERIAAERANNLVERLKEPDFRARRVFELTRNPLLLVNICLVHRHRGALPRKRARFYEECIDVLLEHWRGAKGLQIGVTSPGTAAGPCSRRRCGCIVRKGVPGPEHPKWHLIIEPVLTAVNWSGGSVEDFLRTIRDESGLLTGWDIDNYGFMHMGFQEYWLRAKFDPEHLMSRKFYRSWLLISVKAGGRRWGCFC